MKSLKLFNAVIAKESSTEPFISKAGYIIEPNAVWAVGNIVEYYKREALNGNDLNKTFHKSWKTIKNTPREELLIHQILHYITTYGSDFKSEVYIPDEALDVPDLKLCFKVIKAYTKDEMQNKCLELLKSGVALKEETINDILSLLVDELDYSFTGSEGIKNKESVIKIADLYGVIPTDTMEFFRYIIYRATGESLLIKSKDMIEKIKETNFNPSPQFKKHGIEKLAQTFNRFKPLFLAFKKKCPKTINSISKLSKVHHKPLVANPLNEVTSKYLTDKEKHWLDNATPYTLFKAISACHDRISNRDSFLYRIRNGKSWVKEYGYQSKAVVPNYSYLMNYIKERFNLSGKKIYIPENIIFALPTSEKMFVGNIPTGTKFIGDKLAVGVYWEDDWGARDLDLSGLNLQGKIGWNSEYSQKGELMYSGDITIAHNGAVEYLYANKGLSFPTLVQNNVYSGKNDCGYKIIVGKGDDIDRDYMMNPNNLFLDIKCQSIQKQTILGIFMPYKDIQSFVVLNFGAGHMRVSANSKVSTTATKALYQQWNNPCSFNDLVETLGAEIVKQEEDSDCNLSLDKLEIDSFIKIFSEV